MWGFSEDDAQRQIAVLETVFSGDLRRTLVAIFYAAWRTWTQSILRFLPDCPTRTKRTVLWALLLSEARARFGDSPEITFKETKQGHFFVHIPGGKRASSILIRFKFLKEDLLTSNYPTQGSLQYDRQMPLPGIPPGIRVNAGYRPNRDETMLDGVFVVWSMGLQKLWMKQLDSSEPAAIVPMPLAPAASKKPMKPRRTKVKDDLIKKGKKEPNEGE